MGKGGYKKRGGTGTRAKGEGSSGTSKWVAGVAPPPLNEAPHIHGQQNKGEEREARQLALSFHSIH